MIFIKFKKYIVVALAVLCVVISSCISVFATGSNTGSSVSFDKNKLIDALKNNDNFKEVTEGNNYFVTGYWSSSSSCFSVDVYVTGSQYLVSGDTIFIPNYDCSDYEFHSDNGSTFVFDGRLKYLGDYSIPLSKDNLLLTSYDLKTSDGKLFFQRPIPLLNRLLSQVPQGVGTKVVADLGTLTVCGIGCLALLVGCSLVPKVLHKFRV